MQSLMSRKAHANLVLFFAAFLFRNVLRNFLCVEAYFADLSGWTNPIATKIETVFAEIFLFADRPLKVFPTALVDMKYFLFTIITDSCDDGIEGFFSTVLEIYRAAFNPVNIVVNSYLALAYEFDRSNV